MRLVCWDVCAGNGGRVEILGARPGRGVGQQYSGAGGRMTCPDGLNARRTRWTDALERRTLPETPGYRCLHDLMCAITSFAWVSSSLMSQ
jgi:hypothetical protein